SQSNRAWVITDQTPFYAESGGQVGDSGWLKAGGHEYVVLDTKKYLGAIHGHLVEIDGELQEGQNVELVVNSSLRKMIRANHYATHLLHKALRDVLGEHVTQKGSLVEPSRLRFDFSHPKALLPNEIARIELLVNQMVLANQSTNVCQKSPQQAIEDGAMALF